MLLDPNYCGNPWQEEWNSAEVQNEIMSSGITRDEWEQSRIMDDLDAEFDDDW
ncbi:hypothetical protein [Neobacillus kokaensis]|uniref:Uncharacterized protein n=1 Tax=Neobacillus kokaensis TaxID=2759023 RepID=A0ABQ3MXL4_9BACI|nr:hypothetical protein [Neobacillus kokaensis]GHH97400.1 hypothetical protein AM1BK_09430 [Neobacillus kokaensis]